MIVGFLLLWILAVQALEERRHHLRVVGLSHENENGDRKTEETATLDVAGNRNDFPPIRPLPYCTKTTGCSQRDYDGVFSNVSSEESQCVRSGCNNITCTSSCGEASCCLCDCQYGALSCINAGETPPPTQSPTPTPTAIPTSPMPSCEAAWRSYADFSTLQFDESAVVSASGYTWYPIVKIENITYDHQDPGSSTLKLSDANINAMRKGTTDTLFRLDCGSISNADTTYRCDSYIEFDRTWSSDDKSDRQIMCSDSPSGSFTDKSETSTARIDFVGIDCAKVGGQPRMAYGYGDDDSGGRSTRKGCFCRYEGSGSSDPSAGGYSNNGMLYIGGQCVV
jgi:hypothetical protein